VRIFLSARRYLSKAQAIALSFLHVGVVWDLPLWCLLLKLLKDGKEVPAGLKRQREASSRLFTATCWKMME
jgi:hypothetical protein